MSPVPVRARVPALAAPPLRAPHPGARRPTAPSARPPLRLVDNARLRLAVRQRRSRRLLVVAAVLVGASLLALAASHAMMVSTQVRLDDLDQRVVEAQARHQALRLEVATLEAPDRVVSVAQERLGMAPPDTVTYLQAAAPAESTPEAAPGVASAEEEAEPGTQPSWGAIKPYLGSAR
ncbi:MAG: cell division protein FtsL [Actinobacteria bacterium]|nr:cell division protein FtsL [Actinomycetota bacterium]